MSVKGHAEQISNKQRRLRDALDEFEKKGCGDGCPIPTDACKFATANSHKSNDEIAKENGISIEDVVLIGGALGLAALLVLASPVAAGTGVAACFLLDAKTDV